MQRITFITLVVVFASYQAAAFDWTSTAESAHVHYPIPVPDVVTDYHIDQARSRVFERHH